MKSLTILALSLLVCTGAFAQKPKFDHKRFEAEKRAYITERVGLTEQEAEAFWRLYSKVHSEQMHSRADLRSLKRALRQAISQTRAKENIAELLDAWIDAEKEAENPMFEHKADFVKILGEVKTAKFYLAEEGFRTHAIRALAGKPSPDERREGILK